MSNAIERLKEAAERAVQVENTEEFVHVSIGIHTHGVSVSAVNNLTGRGKRKIIAWIEVQQAVANTLIFAIEDSVKAVR